MNFVLNKRILSALIIALIIFLCLYQVRHKKISETVKLKNLISDEKELMLNSWMQIFFVQDQNNGEESLQNHHHACSVELAGKNIKI